MSFLHHDGTSAAAIRAVDWESTPLGPMNEWPALLRHMLPVLLASAGPKLLLWGPELITFHNDAYLPLLGALGCGIGRPYRELRSDIWPALGQHIEAAYAGSSRLIEDSGGTTWRKGYAEPIHGTLCYTPVMDEEGQVHGVWGDVYDTSAQHHVRATLRRENERLYSLFAHAPFLVAFGWLPEFRLEYVNPAFSRFYGDRPLVGRTVAEAIPEAAEQGFTALLEHVAATGEPWVGQNIELNVSNDPDRPPDQRWLDFIYQPMLDENRHPTGIICFGYDVTEHQLARERADQLHVQLLHTSRVNAMGTMAMTLAHELNQPLTAAANFLAAARRFGEATSLDDDVRSALSHSESQIQRAGQIIRRIRNMVAAGAAKREPVDVRDAVTRSRALLESSGETGEIALDMHIAAGAERVLADQVQLEQILLNLLRNAEEASEDGRPAKVKVTAEPAGESVRISVRDCGAGIEPHRLETLFDALQPSSSGGLGVGLSLCRTMVEAHGGRIWAAAAEGGGTTISFTLPSAG